MRRSRFSTYLGTLYLHAVARARLEIQARLSARVPNQILGRHAIQIASAIR